MENIRRAPRWLLLAPFRLVWWLISLPFRFLGWLFRPIVEKFKQNSIYKFLNEVPNDRPAMEAVVDAFQNISHKHFTGEGEVDCDVLVTGTSKGARGRALVAGYDVMTKERQVRGAVGVLTESRTKSALQPQLLR